MEWFLWVLWTLIAAVIVFILWAGRRAEGHGGMPPIHVPRQRSDLRLQGQAGRREAARALNRLDLRCT